MIQRWFPLMRSAKNRSAAVRLLVSVLACLVLFTAPVLAQTKGTTRNIKKPPIPAVSNYIEARIYFGRQTTPAPLRAEVYGSYARGCIAGAEEMPADGPAWQVMRPSRDRAWAHPKLIALVKRLATEAKQHDGWNGLLVGDLQQPRGGPMLTGHKSHQLGLDADIWLTPMPDRTLSRKERETMSATLMTRSKYKINEKRWTEAHSRLLKRVANYKHVERIFIHPPIKKAMCEWAGNKGAWLAKLRPTYGHNYHFHIRMGCPPDSPGCKPQARPRPADGTGCGAELANWYKRDKARIEARKRAKKARKNKKKKAKKPSKSRHKLVNGIPIPRPKPGPAKPTRPRKNLAWLPKACRALIAIK